MYHVDSCEYIFILSRGVLIMLFHSFPWNQCGLSAKLMSSRQPTMFIYFIYLWMKYYLFKNCDVQMCTSVLYACPHPSLMLFPLFELKDPFCSFFRKLFFWLKAEAFSTFGMLSSVFFRIFLKLFLVIYWFVYLLMY